MIKVTLTTNLQKYYPEKSFQMEASSVLALLQSMDKKRAGFSGYILEDDHRIRKHVNIFVNSDMIDKSDVKRSLKAGDTVHIMQALSGG